MHLFKGVEKLGGLYFPTRTPLVRQDITDRLLIRCHPSNISWNTVSRHLAEVALPFASRTLLDVAETFVVESCGAIITAHDSSLAISAYTTLDKVLVEMDFLALAWHDTSTSLHID